MWHRTALVQKLGIKMPLILAPMAGGPSTPELVAAVSNHGGLGSYGCGFTGPEQVRTAVKAIKKLTDRPYAINLFIPPDEEVELTDSQQAALREVNAYYATWRQRLGLPLGSQPPSVAQLQAGFAACVEVLVEERVPVFSFTFGMPSVQLIQKLQGAGVQVVGTATNVSEAKRLVAAGVDAVIAQGSEAGGHRGTWYDSGAYNNGMIGTTALLPQVVAAAGSTPVIAAGGLMDGRGLVTSLAMGAQAVQYGTAFLACPEAGTAPHHKRMLLNRHDLPTAVTQAFTGKPARGLHVPGGCIDAVGGLASQLPSHKFWIQERGTMAAAAAAVSAAPAAPTAPASVPAASASAAAGGVDAAAALEASEKIYPLWAGQAFAMCRALPAAELCAAIEREAEQCLKELAAASASASAGSA